MKKNPFVLVVICFVALSIGLASGCLSRTHPSARSVPNSNVMASTNVKRTPSVSVTNQPEEIFKVITDEKVGKYAVVYSDKQVVALKNKEGETLWSTNVVELLGSTPIVGVREISSLKLINTQIVVSIGMHTYIGIAEDTGKATVLGSD